MRLELHKVHIKGLAFADTTHVKDGVLYVNKAEAEALIAEDRNFKEVSIDFACPGDKTRIIPVKDAVEPRVKMGKGNYFPGFMAPMGKAGEGQTLVLDGAAVITCGPIVAFQEGFIDMSGPGAPYTPFSETYNVVLSVVPVDDLEKHLYETSLREAGLKLAVYLAKCADEQGAKADEVTVFEKGDTFEESQKYPDLPKVIYVCMNITQGLLHDTYLYAADLRPSLPTLIHPNEVLDGAMVSGNCVSGCDKNTTYHHLNNPVVHDLFEQHGKTLNYVCNIITNENVYLADKQRSSDWTAKLCRLLDLDGVIVSQEGFGNPDTDLIMNTKKIELQGVKTTIITDEYAGQDGKSQSLADADPLADAVVTGGNANEVIVLPKMDKVIGMLDYVDVIAGGHAGSLRPDGTIEAELQVITGATNEMGFNRLSAR